MKILLKLSLILTFVSVMSCANIAKRQTNINNLENIQNLIQELEKANVNINEISNQVNNSKETDRPVRDALTRLFSAFQQMASAYVGVLTSVGKSIGLPTIPIQYMDSRPQPFPIKQITENLNQFQDSVQEVSDSINNFFTRQEPQGSDVLMNQMRKFLRLWSNQIQEVSDQVTRSLGGLQAQPPVSSITIPLPFLDFFQNMMRVFEDTFNDLSLRVQSLMRGQLPNGLSVREEPKPSQMDLLKEFKKLIENIQKRIKAFNQQLNSLIRDNKTDTTTEYPKAEHKEGQQ